MLDDNDGDDYFDIKDEETGEAPFQDNFNFESSDDEKK